MGGIGSTRWGKRRRHARTDEVPALTVRAILKATRVRNPWGSGRLNHGQVWLGDELGLLPVVLDATTWPQGPSPTVALANRWHFDLEPVRTAGGGYRFWFSCPECQRRVGTLYYWPREGREYGGDWYGGRRFEWACRGCHHLLYPTQVESRRLRADRRWVRVLDQLKAEPGKPTAQPARPKGMHRRTYARLLAKLDRAARLRASVAGNGLPGLDRRFPWPATLPEPKAKPRGRSVGFGPLDWRSRMRCG